MDVKRYDYGGGMMEFDTGPYVRFDDYAALLAECDRLRSRVAVLEARPENAIVAGLEYEAAQLRAERDEERTARELMNSVMAGMAEHNARLERERDRLMAALLWLEGAKPGDWRRVSVHHESETGCLVCDLVRARNSTRCEFSRTESVHFASLMRDRVPLVVETIERFLREAEAVLGEKVEVSHEP